MGFGNSVPSAEVPLEQFPDNIFGDATPGSGCNHTPGYIVPAAFDGFAEMWFDSFEEMGAAFRERSYLEHVRPDEQRFLDLAGCSVLVVEELVMHER